jgi:hypothetical protein
MFTGIHCHFPFCSWRTSLLKERFPPSSSISPTYTFHRQHPPPSTSCLLLLYSKVPSALHHLPSTLHSYSYPAILHSFTDSETHPTRQPSIPCSSSYSSSKLSCFSIHTRELSVLPASIPRLITSAFRLQANRQSISQLVHGC